MSDGRKGWESEGEGNRKINKEIETNPDYSSRTTLI
jgi:hypothetical protein|tara:strand:- start:204 stop:311 length:108 start_codon:yes stop_codon:yes gene_type:complete